MGDYQSGANDPRGVHRLTPRVASISTPAAGSEWSWKPGGPIRIIAVRARIVTGAGGTNRILALSISDQSGNVLARSPTSASFAGGLGANLSWFRGAVVINPGSEATLPLPFDVLPPDGSIGSNTANLIATDQWSAIWATYVPLPD